MVRVTGLTKVRLDGLLTRQRQCPPAPTTRAGDGMGAPPTASPHPRHPPPHRGLARREPSGIETREPLAWPLRPAQPDSASNWAALLEGDASGSLPLLLTRPASRVPAYGGRRPCLWGGCVDGASHARLRHAASRARRSAASVGACRIDSCSPACCLPPICSSHRPSPPPHSGARARDCRAQGAGGHAAAAGRAKRPSPGPPRGSRRVPPRGCLKALNHLRRRGPCPKNAAPPPASSLAPA